LNFVKISLDLISPVYYGRDVSEISTVSSLHRKMPFVIKLSNTKFCAQFDLFISCFCIIS